MAAELKKKICCYALNRRNLQGVFCDSPVR